MKKHSFDPSLYLVVNPEQCVFGNVADTVCEAVQGGVTAVQIRSKSLNSENFIKLVDETVKNLASDTVPVIVNDRIDVATATKASGVHLGQEDTSVLQARQTIGTTSIIGLTVRSIQEAEDAPLDCLDYISIGGVFATQSKQNPDPPIGVDQLQIILEKIRSQNPDMPVIAISGINESNIDQVLATGVDGVAVVSAICESENPRKAARRLRDLIESNKPSAVAA